MSCGADGKIKRFPLLFETFDSENIESNQNINKQATLNETHVYSSHNDESIHSIDIQRKTNNFVSATNNIVQVWDANRSSPISNFEWGVDSINCVRFNPSQINIIASVSYDRSVFSLFLHFFLNSHLFNLVYIILF